MISVIPDPTGRAGTAQLRFGNVLAEAAEPRLRIRRDGWDDGTLGPNGWQGEDAWLKPDEVAPDGADLLLTVGWSVCQHLQADTYLISLSRPGTEAPAAWPDIRPVRTVSRTRPRGPGGGATTPAPISEGAAPADERAVFTTARFSSTPAATSPAGEVDQAIGLDSVGSERGRQPYLIGVSLVALLVLAGAGYWYWHAHSNDRQSQVAAASTTAPAPTQTPPSAVPPPPATPAPPHRPQALSDMNVPDVLSHAADLAAITAEGKRRLAGQQHDDGLLLLEEAANRGDGTAMAALGLLYDPVGFQPGGVLTHPDARQAARYYQSAERASAPGIVTKREALRTWLQAKSAAGDVQAGLVLKDFWS